SPTKEPVERWFCIRVFTRSMGYTAVAPVAAEQTNVHHLFKSSFPRKKIEIYMPQIKRKLQHGRSFIFYVCSVR
ncbi:hypothetical protein XENOCAPTIV_027864, partial [Xenoophorus captivus]